jgi:hypothetical protein
MPQLIGFALVGAGCYVAYRWLRQHWEVIATHPEHAEHERRAAAPADRIEKDLGRLDYDPVQGVYRPQK